MVAAGQHHLGPRAGQPDQRLVGQPHRVDLRQRPVVDVTGDDDEVDPLGLDDLEQVVDVRRLVREHPLAVERPAQVPVGGVEDAHVTTVGADADTTREPTPVAVATCGEMTRTDHCDHVWSRLRVSPIVVHRY